MAEKAYKFRLYPNKQQEELIRKTCGCARFVYNVTLAVRQAAYKAGAPLSGNDCVKMLPGLKVQYPWLKEVDSTALQSSVRNMDRAYQNFFASKGGSRKGRAIGFPKFKAKHHCRDGFTCKVGFAVQDSFKNSRGKVHQYLKSGPTVYTTKGVIRLPKLGLVKAALYRTPPKHLIVKCKG